MTAIKGRNCPRCHYPMYAQDKREEPKGIYVHYVCRNGKCKEKFEEKIFEPKK